MALQVKTATPTDSPIVLVTDDGRQYARIVSGNLDGNTPASIPTPATFYIKEKFNVDTDYCLNDNDVLTDSAGVAYWGVTSKRRK